MISILEKKLDAGDFVITTEVCPPKGCDCTEFLGKARMLRGVADAINVTDNQGANMRISSLAAAALLVREGVEPIYQVTCRDRNRMALQSDLLGAAALGIKNVLSLTGDHISFGDHSQAKPVFDLDSVQLMEVIAGLSAGRDMAGNELLGKPSFYVGAAAAPEAEPFAATMDKLEKKICAGARFFQTQAVFEPQKLQDFHALMAPQGVKVIAGIFLLKSAKMARFVNRHIPGLRVPMHIVAELENSRDPLAAGIAIARRLATQFRPCCDGLHIMAMGREDLIPDIIKEIK